MQGAIEFQRLPLGETGSSGAAAAILYVAAAAFAVGFLWALLSLAQHHRRHAAFGGAIAAVGALGLAVGGLVGTDEARPVDEVVAEWADRNGGTVAADGTEVVFDDGCVVTVGTTTGNVLLRADAGCLDDRS